jgi:hypothetical protein
MVTPTPIVYSHLVPLLYLSDALGSGGFADPRGRSLTGLSSIPGAAGTVAVIVNPFTLGTSCNDSAGE